MGRGCRMRGMAMDYVLAEIRLTPPRRARRRMAGLVIPWMLSRRILRWRFAPPLPRPLPPFPPVIGRLVEGSGSGGGRGRLGRGGLGRRAVVVM